MAIGTPTQRGFLDTTSTTTTVITPSSNVASGTVAIVAAFSAGNKTLSSVADSVGNTWTVDAAVTDGSRTINFASCQVASTITTAGSVTLTWSAATSAAAIAWIQEVTGLAASSVGDKTASGTGGGTSLLTSATATLSQADEIVWGCFRTTAGTTGWTKGASYTDPTTPQSTSNTGAALEYKIVSATTAVTADGTWGLTGTWIGVVSTYKGNLVAPTLYTPSRGGGFKRA